MYTYVMLSYVCIHKNNLPVIFLTSIELPVCRYLNGGVCRNAKGQGFRKLP
jgi:hypothetical protein